MRMWDIVDKTDPGTEITEKTQSDKPRSAGVVSRTVLALGLIIVSVGKFSVRRACEVSPASVRIHISVLPSAIQDVWPIGRVLSAAVDGRQSVGRSDLTLPLAVNTPLAKKAEEEMSDFERDYPW